MISSITRLFLLLANLTKNPKKVRKTRKSTTNPPAIPPMYETAMKPLLKWASPQVTCHPGMLIHKLQETFHVMPPLLPSPRPSANSRDSMIFCFPYITESISGSEFCHCNGYIPPKGKAHFNLKQKSDWIHGDLNTNKLSKRICRVYGISFRNQRLQPTMFQWNLLQPLCNERSHSHQGFWLDLMFHQLVHPIPSMPSTVLNPRQVIQESTLREPTKCALKVAPWQVTLNVPSSQFDNATFTITTRVLT